jgi:beta-lactamase class A
MMNFSGLDQHASTMAWSVAVRNALTGEILAEWNSDEILKTASIGKLTLLGYTGWFLLEHPDSDSTRLHKDAVPPVADSGIWQHLEVDNLSMADLAAFVFMSSDNLATNVLLDHFGLEQVRRFGAKLGFQDTILFDIVRNIRGPAEPDTLSVSSAGELSGFMARVWSGEVVNPQLSSWLLNGLSKCMDLSMIPAPLALDPLAHPGPGNGTGVANKTGTDVGIRADAGVLSVGPSTLAYAAICNYEPNAHTDREILALMHAIGDEMLVAHLRR